MTAPADRILFAYDSTDIAAGREALAAMGDRIGAVKLGKAFFTANGPQGVAALGARRVFLDLKFHDIPNTVAGAIRAAQSCSPWMATVHAAGGPAMLRAAADAASEAAARPLVIAVTVLTSLDAADLAAVGVAGALDDQVDRLADLAMAQGCDGVVCAPTDAARLRARLGPDAILVTPGVRPAGTDVGDQKRVATPGEAVAAGADYVVVGRPISAAPDPAAAAAAIAADIAGART